MEYHSLTEDGKRRPNFLSTVTRSTSDSFDRSTLRLSRLRVLSWKAVGSVRSPSLSSNPWAGRKIIMVDKKRSSAVLGPPGHRTPTRRYQRFEWVPGER